MDSKGKRPQELEHESFSKSPATQSMAGKRRARIADSEAAHDEAGSNEPEGVEGTGMEVEEGEEEAKDEEGGEEEEGEEEEVGEEESGEVADDASGVIVNSYHNFENSFGKWDDAINRMQHAVSLQS